MEQMNQEVADLDEESSSSSESFEITSDISEGISINDKPYSFKWAEIPYSLCCQTPFLKAPLISAGLLKSNS